MSVMGRDQTDGQRRKDGTVPSSGTAQRVPGCGARPTSQASRTRLGCLAKNMVYPHCEHVRTQNAEVCPITCGNWASGRRITTFWFISAPNRSPWQRGHALASGIGISEEAATEKSPLGNSLVITALARYLPWRGANRVTRPCKNTV